MTVTGYPNNSLTALSARLREETHDVHTAAEHSQFMTALLNGDLGVDSYVRLLVQYRAIYGALEAAAVQLADDPIVARFAHPELTRLEALDRDLRSLARVTGTSAAGATTGATDAYVARIEDVCSTWSGGFVAHHYVRYLGDLSGGQIIRRILRRHFDLSETDGLSFYVFDQLDNGVQFKKEYREHLDAAPWDADEPDRIVQEARRAFELNIALFESLET